MPPRKLSKTFEYHWGPFHYRPDEIVTDLNEWLEQQHGIVGLTWNLHVAPVNLVRAVTLNCIFTNDPETHRPRFERIPLISGFGGRRRIDLAAALNAWNEKHPDFVRVGYQFLSAAGQPVEVWLLYAFRVQPSSPVPTESKSGEVVKAHHSDQPGGYL
jgi:hypothetical protein